MKSMGMRFKKVRHIAMAGNSERSLVLRQQWALAFFSLPADKVLINLDETWLGMSDFRRMKWQAPGMTNSVAALSMAPRVTMMTAVDSHGGVFLSLAQANSNRQVFGMFLRHLVLKLDRERPGWRKNSVVMLDGASYHAAGPTKDLMRKLRVPVMMLGPYGYQASPCELFFA